MLIKTVKRNFDGGVNAVCIEPSVSEDPSGATGCTTQWNKQPELVILLNM